MFAFLRPAMPPRTNNAANNPIIYENGKSAMSFRNPNSNYIMTHTIPPTTKEEGASIIQPPFHYHIHQDEYFNVQKGEGVFFKGLDPQPFARLSGVDGNRNASIPKRRYHRFENASKTEDLVVDIQLAPEDYENEQSFFRNFFGYLDDCKKNRTPPSIFQLMVFLHSADTPLALPVPQSLEFVGVWISRLFMIGMASWGRWVLGYQSCYPEYYSGKKGN